MPRRLSMLDGLCISGQKRSTHTCLIQVLYSCLHTCRDIHAYTHVDIHVDTHACTDVDTHVYLQAAADEELSMGWDKKAKEASAPFNEFN